MADRRSGGQGLRRSLAILLGAATVVLVLTVTAVLVFSLQLAERRDAVIDRVDPAAILSRDLRSAFVDQESGVRGFVLTGEAAFLEPYEDGSARSHGIKERLLPLVPPERGLQEDVERIRQAAERWRREYAEPAVAGAVEGPDVEGQAFQQRGRLLFDEVRARLDTFDADLDTVRQLERDALESAYRNAIGAVVIQALSVLVVGAVVAVGLGRLVLRPLDGVAARARLVAEGEVSTPVTGEGPAEIRALAADVEAMRMRLVSELEQLATARAAAEANAEELSRSNADLEQFAYVASHDLQEPLRKVAGFCQLLQKRYGGQLDERADEYIHYAVDGAKRMQDLINDLLGFSRVGRTTARFEPIDLAAALRDAELNLASAIEASGARVVADELPTVAGDRRLLVALFQNLVGNAIKFRAQDDPEVRIAIRDAGGEWHVTVSDNGIGIDPEYGEQIFVLFKRLHAKTEYPGTGIGLALCKKIVEFHGGRIWLEAADDAPGAAFSFCLPKLDADGDAADETDETDAGSTHAGEPRQEESTTP